MLSLSGRGYQGRCAIHLGPPLYLIAFVLTFVNVAASLAVCIALAIVFALPSPRPTPPTGGITSEG